MQSIIALDGNEYDELPESEKNNYKRRSYTNEEKQKILGYYDKVRSVAQTSRDMKCNRRNVTRWISERAVIETNKLKSRRNKKEHVMNALVEYEKQLYAWTIEQRKAKRVIINKDMREHMQSLLNHDENLLNKITYNYIRSFKSRHNLTYRKITHKAQESNLEPDQQWIELVEWIAMLNQTASRYSRSRLYNVDK